MDTDLIYQEKTYLTGFNEKIYKNTILETSNETTINNVHLKFNIEFELDKNKKIMSFILQNKNSKVLIKSLDEITDWEFIITSLSDEILDSRSDENLLTGCLTFYETKLENIKIRSENAHCEDSVNFISSTGSINNIEINNASDARFRFFLFANFKDNNRKCRERLLRCFCWKLLYKQPQTIKL